MGRLLDQVMICTFIIDVNLIALVLEIDQVIIQEM